jgi:beta-lactamase regulating signal transducer with metallopeptidase domain
MILHLSPAAVLLFRWTALLTLAWALHALLRTRHPCWRLILWRCVICFIVLMPLVRLPIFQIPLPQNFFGATDIQNVPKVSASPARPPAFTSASLGRSAPSNAGVRTVSAPGALARRPIPWQAMAVSVWALGALWAGGRLVRFQIILHRLRAQSRPAPESVQKQAREIAAGLKVSRRFAVQVSDATTSPFAAGLFRPVILLPGKLMDGLPEEEVTVLMAHEIAHFRRGDLFWCVAWRWLQALFWPHPLIWAIPAAHNLACEEEADRAAAGSLQDSGQYSQLLARLALRVLDLPRLETDLVLNASSHIARRLDKLDKNPAKFWGWKHSVAGFALTAALFLISAACGFSSGGRPPANTQLNGGTDARKMAWSFFDRAELRAEAGLFQDAAADFQQGLQLEPSDHMMWFWSTSLLIQNGDIAKYRTNCIEMLRRFSETKDGSAAEIVAKTCLWIPDAVDPQDSALAAKLADKSVALTKEGDFKPWRRMAKALADYRRGQFKSAGDALDLLLKEMNDAEQAGRKTPSFDPCKADVCFVCAMAHQQVKETEQARAALDQGHEVVRTKLPGMDAGNLGPDWMNILMTDKLMSEADKTMGIVPPSQPQVSARKAPTNDVVPITADDLSKIPHSYQFGDGNRLRRWQRIDDQTWHEVYPDGFTSLFMVVGRTRVGQTEGTVVVKVAGDAGRTGTLNDGTLQAFIPDKGSAVTHHWFRFFPGDKWRDLAPMRDVQYTNTITISNQFSPKD